MYRALKELRQVKKAKTADLPPLSKEFQKEVMGSILQTRGEIETLLAKSEKSLDLPVYQPGNRLLPSDFTPIGGGIDVPFAIGKRR